MKTNLDDHCISRNNAQVFIEMILETGSALAIEMYWKFSIYRLPVCNFKIFGYSTKNTKTIVNVRWYRLLF